MTSTMGKLSADSCVSVLCSAYGQQTCWELANGDPNGVTTTTARDTAAARLTADTYGYFAMSVTPLAILLDDTHVEFV